MAEATEKESVQERLATLHEALSQQDLAAIFIDLDIVAHLKVKKIPDCLGQGYLIFVLDFDQIHIRLLVEFFCLGKHL